MAIEGRTYLLRGEPVTVVCAWRAPRRTDPPSNLPLLRLSAYAPANVHIRHADGREYVRPFRGLRKPTTSTEGA